MLGFRESWQNFHAALLKPFANYFDAPGEEEIWLVDSGAQIHVARDKKLLQNAVPLDESYVYNFFNKKSAATYIGDAYLPNESKEISLSGVYCIPSFGRNVLSVSQLTADFPFSLMFSPSGFEVQNLKTKKVIAKGQMHKYRYIWSSFGTSTLLQRMGKLIKAISGSAANFTDAVYKRLPHFARDLVPVLQDEGCDFCACRASCSLGLRLLLDDDRRAGGTWIIDSGSTVHITNNEALLQNLCPVTQPRLICDSAGRKSAATHIGDAYLTSKDQGIWLRNVLLVPAATENIISVCKLISDFPSCLELRSDGFVLKCLHRNRVIAKGTKHNHDYIWF